MPIWEGQQFIIQELYGIPTSTLIDFDRFQVPFEEPFDLIVCNHMFNHAVRLDGFLAAVREPCAWADICTCITKSTTVSSSTAGSR